MVEHGKKAILEILARQGHEDVSAALEAVLDAVPRSIECTGPDFTKDGGKGGGLYVSVTFKGAKIQNPEIGKLLWTDGESEIVNVDQLICGADVVEAARLLVGKILKMFPEIKAGVKMLLEIRGFDVGWI